MSGRFDHRAQITDLACLLSSRMLYQRRRGEEHYRCVFWAEGRYYSRRDWHDLKSWSEEAGWIVQVPTGDEGRNVFVISDKTFAFAWGFALCDGTDAPRVPLQAMGLSSKAEHMLRKYPLGCETLYDVSQLKYSDIRKRFMCGPKTTMEIESAMQDWGLSFAQEVPR